jgi:hypothetical protein
MASRKMNISTLGCFASSTVTSSTVTSSTMTSSTVTSSTVTSSTVTSSTMTSSTVTSSTVTSFTMTSSAVTSSTVTSFTMTSSAVTNSTATSSTETSSAGTGPYGTRFISTSSTSTSSSTTSSSTTSSSATSSAMTCSSIPRSITNSSRVHLEDKRYWDEKDVDQFYPVIEFHDLEDRGMRRLPVVVLGLIAQLLGDDRQFAGVPYFAFRRGILLYRNLVMDRHWRNYDKISSHDAMAIAEDLAHFHYTSEINPCLDFQIMNSIDPLTTTRDGYYDNSEDPYDHEYDVFNDYREDDCDDNSGGNGYDDCEIDNVDYY